MGEFRERKMERKDRRRRRRISGGREEYDAVGMKILWCRLFEIYYFVVEVYLESVALRAQKKSLSQPISLLLSYNETTNIPTNRTKHPILNSIPLIPSSDPPHFLPIFFLPHLLYLNFFIEIPPHLPMQTKRSEQRSQSLEQSSNQIAIFDQDYWNDERENIATQKTLTDVSNYQAENSITAQIEKEITNTRQNFYRADAFKKCEPIKEDRNQPDFSNPHFILKEGTMHKKTDGFFFPCHERYMVLTSEKLYSFEDQQKEKVISCVNLKILHADLKKTEEGLVLDFRGECENLILKAPSMSDQSEWRALLTQVLAYHMKENKLMLKTMNKFVYDNKDTLTQREFLKNADTGDILLFYTQNFGAKVQRFFTNSDFDHVAMVVKLKKKDLMVFEANQMHGVSIYDWKQYITYFDLYGKVTLRKLNYIRKAEAQATLLQFMKKNLGKKYDLTAFKLLKLESDFSWENVKEDRGYFCSELVAKAFKSVGLLDQKKSSGRYWPVDFSEKSELKLKKGAKLGPEQTVILNKHTKNQV